MSNTPVLLSRIIRGYTITKNVVCHAVALILGIVVFLPTIVFASEFEVSNSSTVRADDLDVDKIDREIRITNGVRTAVGEYPFLTAVMSGRQAVLRFDDGPSSAQFYSGGVIDEFAGELVDCGFAMSVCIDSNDMVCSIILDFPVADHIALTPAMQLQNCRRGGGVAAVFRPNSRNYHARRDLFDGNPSIPAVYVDDDEGYQHLLLALSGGERRVSVTHTVPDNPQCGGTYLGGRWVLTAAHCVVRKLDDGSFRLVNEEELLVNVGAYNLAEEKVFTQAVDEILINDYRLAGGWDENDYALLHLDSEPQRGQPIGIATDESLQIQMASSEPALILGWGSTDVREPLSVPMLTSTTTGTPLAATLQMQPVRSCRSRWRDFLLLTGSGRPVPDIRDIHVCASSEIQQDTCQGDSGGPLLINVEGELQLAGITSFGLGCGGSLGLPGVYARVPSFSQWILRKTGLTRGQDRVRVLSGDTLVTSSSGGGSLAGSFVELVLIALLLSLVRFSRRHRPLLIIIFSFAVLAGAGCEAEHERGDFALISSDSENTDVADTLERVDAIFHNGVISAMVVSTGCTRVQHFSVQHEEKTQGDCEITINRNQPDYCKRAAYAQTVNINWKKPLACEKISFANPTLTRD